MAKAASPVRLQQELMQAATLAGEQLHRSAAEQIEYWAALGRSIAHVVSPDSLLAVKTGLATLKIEPVQIPRIEPDDVFALLERDRAAGRLSALVTSSSVRYQASLTHPGQLERMDADGNITVGQFSMGQFTPIK